MKSAIISGVILVCLMILIVINSFFCLGIIGNLKEKASSGTALTEAGIEAIEKEWQRYETFLHLGVNSRYIDSVSESIVELKAAVKAKSEDEMTSSLDMLIHRLTHLEKLNRFNISNVF